MAAKPRDFNYAKGDKKVHQTLQELHDDIEKGFANQSTRREDIDAYWKMYNCELSEEQLYSGRNRLFAPFTFEAIQARTTRFINQLFPVSDRHAEAASEDGSLPRAAVSMCEHYITDTDLRSVAACLMVCGDVEGQMNLYVDWATSNRRTCSRVEKTVETGPGVPVGSALEAGEEDKPTGGPRIEVISDRDVLVIPATATSVDDAIASGGAVVITRRWSKRQIKNMIRDKAIDEKQGKAIMEDIENFQDRSTLNQDPAKGALANAGIKKDGRGKYATVYEIWTELELETDEYRLCQVFMASKYKVLMARRNPYWCDNVPLISVPLKRVYGSFKGVSLVAPIRKLQAYANDTLNQTADSSAYTLNPVTCRDPAYITSSLVMAPGAVWDVPPNAAAFMQMPEIWQKGADILQALKSEIFQVLSVNPSMVTQLVKKKLNQAEVAQEQQIDILTTGDSIKVFKDGVLNQLLNWFMDLDYQFRDYEITTREYGEMGIQAELQRIPPFEMKKKTTFFWIGDEVVRNAQAVQQKIGFMNVLRQMPPQAIPHYQVDLEPILVDAVETIYGARIGRLALKDLRSLVSLDPAREDQLMMLGHYIQVHPMDDAQKHIADHTAAQKLGDPFNLIAAHILDHQLMVMQNIQKNAQPPGGEQPGQPPKPGAQGPGARPGAMPQQGTPAQQPPGALHQDQMQPGPGGLPRKM